MAGMWWSEAGVNQQGDRKEAEGQGWNGDPAGLGAQIRECEATTSGSL